MARLRSYRKNRRPGNRKPTAEEADRIERAKMGPCMACLVWSEIATGRRGVIQWFGEYNHAKSGNIRVGHGAGYNLCQWHHKGYPIQGLSDDESFQLYGPSLIGKHGGSRTFHATYGSDEELIQRQTDWLDAHSQHC